MCPNADKRAVRQACRLQENKKVSSLEAANKAVIHKTVTKTVTQKTVIQEE